MNLYSRISDLCKLSGDTMYTLSKRTGVSESTLSRLKSNSQVRMSKKNLILLANYFCVNEEWLETGAGDRDAPGVVKDTLIHDEALYYRFMQIAKSAYGDEPLTKKNEHYVSVNTELMSTYTDIPQSRLREIINENQFPTYTEIQRLLKSDKRIDANWLILGVGSMYRLEGAQKESMRVSTLVDTIATLQDTINAKSETIAVLMERIKQLENQNK